MLKQAVKSYGDGCLYHPPYESRIAALLSPGSSDSHAPA